jgi:hypothetical protein
VQSTDLSLRCWGSTAGGLTGTSPGPYYDVSVAEHHACAVLSTGYMQCWGSNPYGEAPTTALY